MQPDAKDLSLNEVEGLARLAARGGGLSWGLADDAGRSARWLAAHGVDWATSLLALLDQRLPPEQCPLHAGCFLADSAAAVGRCEFARVAAPVWLLPPLLAAAAAHGLAFVLHIGHFEIGGLPPLASARLSKLAAEYAAPVQARFGGAAPLLPFALPHPTSRFVLPPDLASRLHVYAARTFVPASDLSRVRGAGSTTRDDD